jgi:hypothetical protein
MILDLLTPSGINSKIIAALFVAVGRERATLLRFTAAEGAGGHCEAFARSLYHQRVYDWLDETLSI